MRLLAIDPGAHSLGWASFQDGLLMSAGWAGDQTPSAIARLKPFQRPTDLIVVEVPQVYVARSGAPPGDLVDVAVMAGLVIGLAVSKGAEIVQTPRPAEWKGQVPKAVLHSRLWSLLSAVEEASLRADLSAVATSKRHNVLDAVGIGLWALRRMERGGK